ncbi:MFS transporter [Stakelama marina]|uniref:MFS transporter n=1 Tax=Stakelama marina TaxID=2826939 RepID=A0A8T4I954_9SPHN|nr:glycoside-pentoside-hexuronide (GPH):cation symporter [Stakelama marina]MBR0551040.1 MFS transporter [Stakelama marina]
MDADKVQESNRLGWGRLTLFASGDFACNLYWQSLIFYLFFFYTETLGLPAATAGLVYMIGSFWDGLADLAVGLRAERSGAQGGYRRFVGRGAVPLGLAFILLYFAPPFGLAALTVFALAVHFLFRTLYATVNVPYSALTTRISDNSRDRATISGLRMLFGTAAAGAVALFTPRIGLLFGQASESTGSFLTAAIIFALAATAILLMVAAKTPERLPVATTQTRHSLAVCARVLLRNRAFVTLNLAMVAIVIGVTILTKSVLYYFTYSIGDTAAGSAALALMAVAGTAFVPLWMVVERRIGTRAIWFVSTAVALSAIGAYTALRGGGAIATQAFLVAMQAGVVGVNFAFWAILPDTVEYGEHRQGVRVEAMAFGVAALIQKLALGLAAGLMGLIYSAVGYVAHADQTAETLAGMRWSMLLIPAIGFILSALVMIANPLRRGTHAAIVADLARSREVG